MVTTVRTCAIAFAVLLGQAAWAQAPTIASPEDDSTTSNRRPPFSGTAPANERVWVYDGNEPLGYPAIPGYANANGSGGWGIDLQSDLSVGLHHFTADVMRGYWKLDETSGTTAADSSGQGSSGTITGGASPSTDIPSSILFDDDRSLAFDGTDDHVALGNPTALNFSGQITIAAWVKRTSGGYHYIAGHTEADNDPNVALYSNSDAYVIGVYSDYTNHVASSSQYSQDRNVWVHLAGVYDGTTWRLYRNGEQIASTVDSTGSVTVSGNWAIGAAGSGYYGFMAGNLDDVRIYNRGLSATEVSSLAQGKPAAAVSSTDVTIAEGPVVSSIVRAGSSPTNVSSVSYTVTFSVDVTGVDTADFSLTTTESISGASVTGVSGSGNSYTVTVGTGSNDGTIRLDVPVTATIEDAYENSLVGLPYTGGEVYEIDKTQPTVTDVTSDVNDEDPFQAGAYIPVKVEFSEAVDASGSVLLKLATGGEEPHAPWTDVSGTNTLIFGYQVLPGDGSLDLDYENAASLTIESGYIRDAAGNSAVLTLPTPGETGSLGYNKNIEINTAATLGPTITSPTSPTISTDASPNFSGTGPYPGYVRIFDDNVEIEFASTNMYGDWDQDLSLAVGVHHITVEASQGHWAIDDTSGTSTPDSSGHDIAGTLVNDASPSADVPSVDFSNTLSIALDGVDDYVNLGNPTALNFSGRITMAMWVKRASNGYNIILAHTENPTTNPNVAIYSNAGGYTVGTYDGANHVANVAGYEGDVNQWVHLAGVHDGTSWKLYRNGILIATTLDSTGAVAIASGNWAIGAAGTGNYGFFSGKIDDVRIYNRALSADEIGRLADGKPATSATTIYTVITPLTVTIDQGPEQDDPTDVPSILFTVEFNESVTDFTAQDVNLSESTTGAGTAVTAVDGSGNAYVVTVTGMSQAGVVIASIDAGVAHDATGNPNVASTSADNEVTFIVQQPPAVPVITTVDKKTNDNTPIIAGTSDPNVTITVYFGGVSDGTTTANGSGVWNYHNTQASKQDGNYAVTAKASISGLQSGASDAVAITVDTSPPDVPTDLQAISRNGAMELSWDASSAADTLGYNIYRKAPGESVYTKINPKVVVGVRYLDSGLSGTQEYSYKVSAVDDTLNEWHP